MIDLGCLIVLALFAYAGWRRGLLLSAFGLLGIVAGYLAAYFLYRPLGELVSGAFSLQPLIAYPIGGFVAFTLTGLLLGLLRFLVRRRHAHAVAAGSPFVLPGRVGGALLGLAHGSGFVLVVIGALLWLQAVAPGQMPDVRSSIAGRIVAPLTASLFRSLARAATGGETLVGPADQLARDPRRAAEGLARVLASPKLQAVVASPKLSRDPVRLEQSGALRALARDREFLRSAEQAGLLEPGASRLPPEQAARQLATRVAPLVRGLHALTRDPEARRLLRDPKLREALARRDLLALANDPRFNRLTTLFLDEVRRASP